MLTNDRRLTDTARRAAETADAVRLSPISFFEVSQKVRLGKWPDMAPYLDDLPDLARDQGLLSAPITPEVATLAGAMPWPHRDPFDRFLAATVLLSGAVLLSADAVFDTLAPEPVRRIW